MLNTTLQFLYWFLFVNLSLVFDKWSSPLKMFPLQDGPVYQTNGRNRSEVVVVVKVWKPAKEHAFSKSWHTCTFVYLLCGEFVLDFPLNFKIGKCLKISIFSFNLAGRIDFTLNFHFWERKKKPLFVFFLLSSNRSLQEYKLRQNVCTNFDIFVIDR